MLSTLTAANVVFGFRTRPPPSRRNSRARASKYRPSTACGSARTKSSQRYTSTQTKPSCRRSFSRPFSIKARWSLRVIGEAIGRWRGETQRAHDRRPHLCDADPQQRHELGRAPPQPLESADVFTIDTLGRSRRMSVRKWAWLIGASDASDGRLVDWAKSFAMPPSLDIRGARLQFSAYAAERRAIRFEVLSNEVEITIKPGTRCINPVFEFENASSAIANVTLAGGADADRYALGRAHAVARRDDRLRRRSCGSHSGPQRVGRGKCPGRRKSTTTARAVLPGPTVTTTAPSDGSASFSAVTSRAAWRCSVASSRPASSARSSRRSLS